jgi:hypothetical protein
MAFGDMFRTRTPAPQPSNVQNQQPSNQQQQNNNQGNNPNDGIQGPGTPPNSGNQGNPENPQHNQKANPLDQFNNLWDTSKQGQPEAPPSFSIDDKVLDSVVSQQDFTKGVDSELVKKAMAGDAQSMMDVMQAIGRNAYRASLQHGGLLTDKFVSAREAHSEKGFQGKVRQELTTSALADTPNFSHPVVKKQLTAIAKQFASQNPDASPQEIAKMSKDYLQELVTAITPTSEDDTDPSQRKGNPLAKKGKEVNWDKWFDEEEKGSANMFS